MLAFGGAEQRPKLTRPFSLSDVLSMEVGQVHSRSVKSPSGKRHGDMQFYAIVRRPRRTYRHVGHWPFT